VKRISAFETNYGRVVNHTLTALSVVYLGDYSWLVLGEPKGQLLGVLNTISNLIYVLFAIDFVFRVFLFFSQDKTNRSLRTFIISNALPALALFAPAFRTLRLFRLLLTLRGFVGLVKNRAESAGLLVVFSFPLVAYTTSLAVLDAERYAPGANIRTLKEALWWSVITMTTVGYGDHYPVTDEGKLIASCLLVFGIIIFSTITAIVSTWILAERKSAS